MQRCRYVRIIGSANIRWRPRSIDRARDQLEISEGRWLWAVREARAAATGRQLPAPAARAGRRGRTRAGRLRVRRRARVRLEAGAAVAGTPRAPPGPVAVLARLRGGVATPRRRHRCTVSRAHGRQRGLDRPSVWSPVRRGLGARRRRAAVALCPRRLTPRGSAIAGHHVWRAHRRATRRPRSLPASRRNHEFSTPSRATSAQSSRNRYPHKATNDQHRRTICTRSVWVVRLGCPPRQKPKRHCLRGRGADRGQALTTVLSTAVATALCAVAPPRGRAPKRGALLCQRDDNHSGFMSSQKRPH